MTASPTAPHGSTEAAAATTRTAEHPIASTIVVILGWLAVGAIALGVAIALVPVGDGATQDCGAPGAFLIEGRADVYPDADGRVQRGNGEVEQLSPAEVSDAYERPCSERVADRMVPAGIVLATGAGTGLLIAVAAGIGAVRRRPKRHPVATSQGAGEL
ncbi:MAG: hypothetical protein WKF43_14195 [Acidimicrobiales bacterium]